MAGLLSMLRAGGFRSQPKKMPWRPARPAPPLGNAAGMLPPNLDGTPAQGAYPTVPGLTPTPPMMPPKVPSTGPMPDRPADILPPGKVPTTGPMPDRPADIIPQPGQQLTGAQRFYRDFHQRSRMHQY